MFSLAPPKTHTLSEKILAAFGAFAHRCTDVVPASHAQSARVALPLPIAKAAVAPDRRPQEDQKQHYSKQSSHWRLRGIRSCAGNGLETARLSASTNRN